MKRLKDKQKAAVSAVVGPPVTYSSSPTGAAFAGRAETRVEEDRNAYGSAKQWLSTSFAAPKKAGSEDGFGFWAVAMMVMTPQ